MEHPHLLEHSRPPYPAFPSPLCNLTQQGLGWHKEGLSAELWERQVLLVKPKG